MKLGSLVITIIFSLLAITIAAVETRAVEWEVEIEDFAFVPHGLRISVGDSIEWRNRDLVGHSATSDDGVFDSGILSNDQRWSFVFTSAGTFPYHCSMHLAMRDTIFVLGPTGIDNPAPEIPEQFAINQNYPNPFNATTTIGYALPQAGHVTIEIFNLLGQCVVTLADQIMTAGYHETVWDAGNRQSGVFFYTVSVNGQRQTGRMVLLK